ncbi:MAG: SDR family oxidoreductase [Gammaproteobacteria bacterium]|nr:SDR family oxidoreductase [Gammaproteobacteria bacterium]
MKENSLNLATYPSLRGRTVFITGGGSGIGEKIVDAFCNQRSKVSFVDIKREESLKLCDRLESETQNRPLYIECDLRDIDALRSAIEQTRQQLGNIAVLINNAANDARIEIKDVTKQIWDDQIAVNLRPSFFAAQAVYDHMKELGYGSIINFGSVCWSIKQGQMHAYAASKAAMSGLTRSLARDFGINGIRVNTLVPGWVMTERQLANYVNADTKRWINETQCIKKQLKPEDVANLALFLAADDSAMISAETFVVDGGLV